MKVLLGVTGSIAAKLTPQLVQLLSKEHVVQIVATRQARNFFDATQLTVPIWNYRDEMTGDGEILHIALRRWADALLIAPLTAHTLARLANGLADDLLTSVARAWDMSKPIIVAPAMNTFMWEHPATKEHLTKLRRWYPRLVIVQPVIKTLACGDHGMGAMAPLEKIEKAVVTRIKKKRKSRRRWEPGDGYQPGYKSQDIRAGRKYIWVRQEREKKPERPRYFGDEVG